MPIPATGPVRCLLVRPRFLENTFYNPREMFRLLGSASAAPPLGLLTVAAHLPSDWELRLVDGDLDDPIEVVLEPVLHERAERLADQKRR